MSKKKKGISGEFSGLFSAIKDYLRLYYDLLKLEVVDSVTVGTAAMVSSIVLLFFVLLFLLFFSFATALYLDNLLNSSYLGFFIVSVFYLFLLIMAFLFRKTLFEKPIAGSILKRMMDEKDEQLK